MREEGWYWVKYQGYWSPQYFDTGFWRIGYMFLIDSQVEEIDERKIVRDVGK